MRVLINWLRRPRTSRSGPAPGYRAAHSYRAEHGHRAADGPRTTRGATRRNRTHSANLPRPSWADAPTKAYPVRQAGRPGSLTPAQIWRSTGRRQ